MEHHLNISLDSLNIFFSSNPRLDQSLILTEEYHIHQDLRKYHIKMVDSYEHDEHVAQNIYSAMEGDETDKDYLANVAMAALNLIKNEPFEINKSNPQSEYYREEGNEAYKAGSFQKALFFYNKALLFAPNMSLSLKLAYSNRSAVLFSTRQYRACEKDCDTALGINCPTPNSLTEKLEKRRQQAKLKQHFEILAGEKNKKFQEYADHIFKLKSQHKDISCASADIDIVFESGIPKVIAKRDIPAGTLVAMEKAFVCCTKESDTSDTYFSCYYCRKLDLNLFPCTGCVCALFCSRQCRDTSMIEYHSVECEIIGKNTDLPNIAASWWLVAAIIKLRNMCSSWEELIALSHKGRNGKASLKIDEIYDSSKPSSLLNFKKDRHFLHGAVFNKSLLCAVLLKVFQNSSFLPQDEVNKMSALKAIAKIMMNWELCRTTTNMEQVAYAVNDDTLFILDAVYMGLFAFIGKLKHSCVPNLYNIAVNNSMALFAVEHIEAGTELTFSHVFHWLNYRHNPTVTPKNFRIRKMNEILFTTCSCFVCSKSPENYIKDELTDAQKQAALECFTLRQCKIYGIPPKKCMDQIFKILTLLNNVKYSAEYKKVYRNFIDFLLYLLYNKLGNTVLSIISKYFFLKNYPNPNN